MIIWVSKYTRYVDVEIIKGDYRYIIECRDNYITEEFKIILNELNINYMVCSYSIMISYKDYNFDKIGGINIFIDKCKNIINHKHEIKKLKEELTI